MADSNAPGSNPRHKKTRQVEKLKQALPALAVFLGARKLIFKSAPGGYPPLYYPHTLRPRLATVNTRPNAHRKKMSKLRYRYPYSFKLSNRQGLQLNTY